MSQFSLSSYDFDLPAECIAQRPAHRREASRLLYVSKSGDQLLDKNFPDLIDLLSPGDLLVVNDTRVFPARLQGKKETGGRVELMLLHYPVPDSEEGKEAAHPFSDSLGQQSALVTGLVKSSRRPKPGSQLIFGPALTGEVVRIAEDATVEVRLFWRGDLDQQLQNHGGVPLPPYIERNAHADDDDHIRYQTVYAANNGAIAAPTAGLHFTDALLQKLQRKGVALSSITLHVGYGTFAPVRVEDIRAHRIHAEFVTISQVTADLVNKTKREGGRVWAVGTTTTRALEFAADGKGGIRSVQGLCSLYIYPGYHFQVVDSLVTNFHLPKSSLLFMVSAFAGRQRIMAAYQEAIRRGYRFYSYGDAMVITDAEGAFAM